MNKKNLKKVAKLTAEELSKATGGQQAAVINKKFGLICNNRIAEGGQAVFGAIFQDKFDPDPQIRGSKKGDK